jgi:hypothetical protein
LYAADEVIAMAKWRQVATCACVLVAVLAAGVLAATVKKVINYGNGNAVFLVGGEKPTHSLGLAEPLTGPRTSAQLGSPYKTKTLATSKLTPYGDRYVVTSFCSTLYIGITCAWAEVSGTSQTAWYGYVPQFYSSRIRLDEVWTFGGIGVSVSVPPGAGFSSSSRTATWSGDDSSGQTWMLGHKYSGIAASAFPFLTSINQASNGSHYFDSDHWWASANAKKGITSL